MEVSIVCFAGNEKSDADDVVYSVKCLGSVLIFPYECMRCAAEYGRWSRVIAKRTGVLSVLNDF